MCICILKTKDGKITKKRLQQAYKANPDGTGLLGNINQYNSIFDDGFLIYRKGTYSWRRFNIEYDLFPYDDNLIIHFRTASSNGVGYDYCHPHFVNGKLAFVHNGNLFEFSSYFKGRKKDNRIDTQRFNDEILKKLPDNFLDNPDIFTALNEYCKNNMSKMIFMNNTGKYWIINEDAGEWKDGCWYSNKGMNNYQGYGYSGAYYYNKDDIRHKGGLPTVQFINEDRRKNWYHCKNCGGWFHKNHYLIHDFDMCVNCYWYFNLLNYCEG